MSKTTTEGVRLSGGTLQVQRVPSRGHGEGREGYPTTAPTLHPSVTFQTIVRLRRDLPQEIHEIVIAWVEQAYTILADTGLQTPGAEPP